MLRLEDVTRRIAAFAGLVLVVFLALLLLYRVWLHHQTIEGYDEDEAIVQSRGETVPGAKNLRAPVAKSFSC